jgi:hypothetical protein
MLTIINLYTIDKIFSEETDVNLSAEAKMLYVNCLIHHFRGKTPTVANAIAFSMLIGDMPKYKKFERLFFELHKAGLVVVDSMEVRFENHWGKHIDRSKLDKVSPDTYVAGFALHRASHFKSDMLAHERLYELMAMKHKATKRRVEAMIDLFVKEQDTLDKTYTSFSDCVKHFSSWFPYNLPKSQNEHVKAGGKILGLDNN